MPLDQPISLEPLTSGQALARQALYGLSGLFLVLDSSKGFPQSLADAKDKGIPIIAYGQFINDIVAFLVVALAVFLLVRQVNRVRSMVERPATVAAAATKECSFCASAIPIRASRCPQCTSQL